jgi:hypothetical protein
MLEFGVKHQIKVPIRYPKPMKPGGGVLSASTSGLANTPIGYGDALTILLTAESLLLAALGLAIVAAVPNGRRIPRLPLPPFAIGLIAVGAILVTAIGSGAAWWQLFITQGTRGVAQVLIAGSILVTIIAEPVIALLLAMGMRKDPTG